VPRRNKIVQTRTTWSPEWTISFDIKPMGPSLSAFTNVLHMVANHGKDRYGRRIPMVSFRPNSTVLHICASIKANRNYCFNTPPLVQNQWSNVIISQRLGENGIYEYSIMLDGIVLHNVTNSRPRTFQNAKLYISNPRKQSANALLKSIKVVDHQINH